MSEPHPPILGREHELQVIDGLLHAARGGESGALGLVGPAGNGKTALLTEATRRALEQPNAMTVLRARGIESEAEVAFAGLLELVRPLASLIPLLPEPQARALEGALALVPVGSTDRFSVSAATLAILSLAATDSPVFVVVDDLHWLDPPSAQAILFAARRLWREGVAILLSSRPEPHVLGQLEGVPVLEVGPLPADHASALARAVADRRLSDDEVEALVVGTGGNPLAILEVARQPRTAGFDPAGGGVLPLPVAERIQVGVQRRLERLSPDARRAVLIAAAAGTRAPSSVVARALDGEGLSLEILDGAESEGLLRARSEAIEFEHPLTRSAAYGCSASGEQRRAHRALAVAFPDGSAERAWHLAASVIGPDDEAAQALEAAGQDAVGRGAPSSAERAFARAADLSTGTESGARRLLLCGDAARLAGRTEPARQAIIGALERSQDPLLRADALGLLFQIDAWRAPVATAPSIAAEAERLATLDPRRSARMLAEASTALTRSGSIPQGVEFAERASAQAVANNYTDEAIDLSLLFARVMDARAPEALDGLVALGERLLEHEPSAQTLALLQQVAWLDTWVEQYEQAAVLLEHAVSVGRARAPGTLPMTLAMRGELLCRRARWQAALADTTEAAALAGDFGQLHPRGLALTCQARIQAGLGLEEDCRTTAAEAAALGLAIGGEGSPVSAYGAPALGLLEIGLGRPDAAIPHLELLITTFRKGGIKEPGVVLSAGDLIEAYARCDRTPEAHRLLEEFQELALRSQRLGAQAIAARCRGLLAAPGEIDEHFTRALNLHAVVDMPFEEARSLLAYGERLSDDHRNEEAAERLRSAWAGFQRLGAADWEERARAALAALGEPLSEAPRTTAEALTPLELQVALVAASGASSPEAAAQLFLSTKTVEAHLERIYTKLGVRSPAELAARVAARAGGAPVAITTFGEFSVSRNGRRISRDELGGEDALLALAVLLAARAPVRSDALEQLVWPGEPAAAQATLLEAALEALTSQLGPERLTVDAGTVALELHGDDDWDAQRLLELGRNPAATGVSPDAAREALGVFSAALLPEWPAAPWRQPLDSACSEALSRLRGHLAEALLGDGRHEEALAHFTTLSDAEPTEQAWHRGIMRCHAAAGDLPSALRQYHVCRSALRQVRDEDPDAQTRALYMELLGAG